MHDCRLAFSWLRRLYPMTDWIEGDFCLDGRADLVGGRIAVAAEVRDGGKRSSVGCQRR